VHGLIVDLHDLTFGDKTMGDVDDGLEDLADDLGNGRLAIARRPIQQERGARVDGRAQAGQQTVGDDDVFERFFHHRPVDGFTADLLLENLVAEGFDWHRRGAKILALVHRLDGELAAGLGKAITHLLKCTAGGCFGCA